MTGYESKKAAAIAKTIDEVNWLDHEPNGVTQPAQECEALKLALEVLENLPGYRADIDNAITAIKEVLEKNT